MTLIWNQIPKVIQLIIGFIVWFSIYFAWVLLDKKWYEWESRILLWTWILINFLVILAWRYLIWDNYWNSGILWIWVTFLFLVLNTVFAIVTSFVYKSRTLLIFSFIFAYLNPFLIWDNSTTAYLLVWYSMIISLWALYLWIKQNDNILKLSSFILWNILILSAPFSWDIEWIIKLLSSWILWLITIFSLYNKNSVDKNIWIVFILNYVFIVLLLGGSWVWILWNWISYISYMISILLFFWVWVFLVLYGSIKNILPLFVFPLLIILWLSFVTGFMVTTSLAIVVLVYLIWFIFLSNVLSSSFKYIFFILLAIFICFINSFVSFNSYDLTFSSFLITVIVSFIFLFTIYFFSTKKDCEYLYTIWTIWWILILLPILVYEPIYTHIDWVNMSKEIVSTQKMLVSIISVVLFALSNQFLPFINKNLINKNIKNLVIWSVFWVLFIWLELFLYWDKYFPWVTLWLAFGVLAIVYFILWVMMMNKLWIDKVKTEFVPKNVILSYLFISISIFSLAIIFVFSTHKEIISTVWLFEASILLYFFNKTKEFKIYLVWLILFIIWIFNLFPLLDMVREKEFMFLVSFSIIALSFISNLKSLNFVKDWFVRISHDVFHIVWIWILWALLYIIIPNTWYGWALLWISSFVFFIWILYSYFESKILKVFFFICFIGLMISHIGSFDYIIRKIDRNELSYLRILQYMSTFILWYWIFWWNKLNKVKIFNNFVNWAYVLYILIIVSYYIDDIFGTTFAVTIFWWIISSILLMFGIIKDKIKYRTLWLYLLSLVLIKICIDLFIWIDDGVTRILALIGIWTLLIIVSLLYSKRYWNNLLWEFDFSNLFDEDNNLNSKTSAYSNVKRNDKDSHRNIQCNDEGIKPSVENDIKIEKQDSFNESIKDVDVFDYKAVNFIYNDKKVQVRAVNLLKIAKFVIVNMDGKTKFEAWELREIYDYIKSNFKSDLSRDNYNRIIKIMDDFVESGGEVLFVEK